MKKLFILLLCISPVLAWAVNVYYQDRVVDRYGTGQFNRVVQLRNSSDTTTTLYSDTSDADGLWSLSTLAPATYVVYVDSVRNDIIVITPDIMDSFTVGNAATDTVRSVAFWKFTNGTSITSGISDSLSAHDKLYDSLPELKGRILTTQLPITYVADTARASGVSTIADSTKGGSVRSQTALKADSTTGGAARSITSELADSTAGGAIRSQTALSATLADSAAKSASLGGYAGSAYPRLAANNTFTVRQKFDKLVYADTLGWANPLVGGGYNPYMRFALDGITMTGDDPTSAGDAFPDWSSASFHYISLGTGCGYGQTSSRLSLSAGGSSLDSVTISADRMRLSATDNIALAADTVKCSTYVQADTFLGVLKSPFGYVFINDTVSAINLGVDTLHQVTNAYGNLFTVGDTADISLKNDSLVFHNAGTYGIDVSIGVGAPGGDDSIFWAIYKQSAVLISPRIFNFTLGGWSLGTITFNIIYHAAAQDRIYLGVLNSSSNNDVYVRSAMWRVTKIR